MDLCLGTTPSVPQKTNPVLDVMFSSTTNLDIFLSRFVVLENVPSNTRLSFFGTERVSFWGAARVWEFLHRNTDDAKLWWP